jgi:hypothetical protein
VIRPDRADPTRPVWFGGVSGSLRFRAPVAADAPVGYIVSVCVVVLVARGVLTSGESQRPTPKVRLVGLSDLYVWFVCRFCVSSLVVGFSLSDLLVGLVSLAYLSSLLVWSACTINVEYPLVLLEQRKRSSPKTLCRGPNGVLTNPVFDLLVRAL